MSEYQNDLPSATTALPTRNASIKSRLSSEKISDAKDLPLDASEDARRIVRLVQCSQCSHPFESPMTLPCGNTLCKRCLPELHLRPNISYPATANRLQGFTCPFVECGQEHAAGDCSLDVVLSKLMNVVKDDINSFRPTASDSPLILEERDKWAIAGVANLSGKPTNQRVLQGGRLVSTYILADMGELAYDSEVYYTTISESPDDYKSLDIAVLEHLKTATRAEMDCQVCYALFLDPITTSCGHTFCRKCLRRALDHSDCCPICRRELAISPALTEDQYPTNNRLLALIMSLCPEHVAARAETVSKEDIHEIPELDTPLFICTLSFPTMPTFLHIFEPRYRLMIRRAMESGERKFGMLLPNPRQAPQGELGPVGFYRYGTLLHIVNLQLLPDGRSLIETVGVSRFRVVDHGTLDAYLVGQVERIDDISLADEEALEASETATPSTARPLSAAEHFGSLPHHGAWPGTGQQDALGETQTLSTQALMERSTAFVRKMKDQSAPWLQTRVIQAYGPCPTDPALFPWWFASILPVAEVEKYKLLETRSVRERLKICLVWIVRIEAQRR
ncbi:MAG: hypothetical protein M1818_007555 [Claussenomyces sp. TS43310]|nr:MAG: hypothetical protein M1818_007555 [Claussenomyces sp. TS43310]